MFSHGGILPPYSARGLCLNSWVHYSRLLLRKLPISKDRLPVEVQRNIDIESYTVKQASRGKITLPRGTSELQPIGPKGSAIPMPEDLETLSQIIHELNERFSANLGENARTSIQQLETQLAQDPALEASIRANTRDNARLTFEHVLNDRLQDIVDSDFKFYKQVTDNQEFAKALLDWMFERFYRKRQNDFGK